MADAIQGLASRWFPYRKWHVIVTNGIADYNDYYFICFYCFAEIETDANLPSFSGFNTLAATVGLT